MTAPFGEVSGILPVLRRTLILALATTVLVVSVHAAEPPRSKVKRFVHQVILGAELGSDRRLVSRWMTSPTLSVFNATAEEKRIVQEVIDTINPAIAPSGQVIQLVADNISSATMRVYFAPLSEFPKIARGEGIPMRKE